MFYNALLKMNINSAYLMMILQLNNPLSKAPFSSSMIEI